MGAVITKRGAVGQWGSRLYVSTRAAEVVCREIWKVPAELADIEFLRGEEESLKVKTAPPPLPTLSSDTNKIPKIVVGGWSKTHILVRR